MKENINPCSCSICSVQSWSPEGYHKRLVSRYQSNSIIPSFDCSINLLAHKLHTWTWWLQYPLKHSSFRAEKSRVTFVYGLFAEMELSHSQASQVKTLRYIPNEVKLKFCNVQRNSKNLPDVIVHGCFQIVTSTGNPKYFLSCRPYTLHNTTNECYMKCFVQNHALPDYLLCWFEIFSMII